MAAAKKRNLALREMGDIDDFLTDALIDKVYYWTTIRKTRQPYFSNRKLKPEEVISILTEHVIRKTDITIAIERVQNLNGIKQYMEKFAEDEVKATEFTKHLRRYLYVYHPEAGWEINSTNRYTLSEEEACVISRRPFKVGDTIKFLTGTMCRLTDEEEASLNDNTDFSIICSSRAGGTSILLGPARFINHDCNPNCKFTTTNPSNITVSVIRDIQQGEEVTVKYSDDYFGDGNCECLCVTCEKNARNGFGSISTVALQSQESINDQRQDIVKKRRSVLDINCSLNNKRRRIVGEAVFTPPPLSDTSDIATIPDTSSFLTLSKLLPNCQLTPPPSDGASTPFATQAEPIAASDAPKQWPGLQEVMSDCELSEMDDEELEALRIEVGCPKHRIRRRKKSGTETKPLPRGRVPGDVNGVPRKGVKVFCVDCQNNFWHKETWFFPRSCPRCERHSKLYGYRWPKTVKRSKFDNEVQVEDPRTIVRELTARQLKAAIGQTEKKGRESTNSRRLKSNRPLVTSPNTAQATQQRVM